MPLMNCGSGSGAPAGAGNGPHRFSIVSPWLNQSRTMNWIHAASRALPCSNSWNGPRFMSSSLTSRGFGSMTDARVGCGVGATLRPNRVQSLPAVGRARSL